MGAPISRAWLPLTLMATVVLAPACSDHSQSPVHTAACQTFLESALTQAREQNTDKEQISRAYDALYNRGYVINNGARIDRPDGCYNR